VKLFLALLFACMSHLACANGLDALDAFIKTTKNGRAEFTQTVTSPSSGSGVDMKAGKVKLSHGAFEFLRPNRFKFIYTRPFEQSIVADGQTLWLYDVDLNQVTSRKQSAVMAGSPAALFASAADLKSLQAEFNLQAAPDKNGLEWISAKPKTTGGKDSLLQSVKVGFKQMPQGVEIAALEMVDSFGQLSSIQFDKVQINTSLSAADFNFKVPAGVDVIKQ